MSSIEHIARRNVKELEGLQFDIIENNYKEYEANIDLICKSNTVSTNITQIEQRLVGELQELLYTSIENSRKDLLTRITNISKTKPHKSYKIKLKI